MYIFVLIIHIIVSLVLIAVILLQAGKGGGLADTFGGGGGGQTTIFGQKASAFLTKATTVSAILFLCTSLSLAYLSGKRKSSLMQGVKIAVPATEQPSETQAPSSGAEPVKTTVKHIEVDPQTGQEKVVSEETLPGPAQKPGE